MCIDLSGECTVFAWNGDNHVTATTDALGRQTQFSYDAAGNVTAITDPDNQVTRFEYEPTFNRVTKIADALNQVTTFTYDAQGNLLTTTDPLTHTTTITYNAFGQPTSVTDPLNNMSTFDYDAQGNLLTTTDPLGHRTQRAYDGVSRLIALTDPRGLVTSFSYDLLNRVTEITDARQGRTAFTYDPNGNLLSVSDAKNQTTTYTYDTMDRLPTRKDALGREETYEYDPAGDLVRFTDRKHQVSTFEYDDLNRRTKATYANGRTRSFVYDAVGRLVQAVDSATGTIEIVYDAIDRLIKEISAQGVVDYGYDALGRRTRLTANGGALVNYAYDPASRLTQVSQSGQSVTLGYDAAGRRTSLGYPNGVTATYIYDLASRLTMLMHQGPGGVLESLTYSYDPAGNRISFSRTGRVATQLPAAAQAAYDAANQQIQFGSATQQFDGNGNLIFDGIRTYLWDALNQLERIEGGPEGPVTFQYDALGRRVNKTVGGVRTSFLYDRNDVILELSGGTVASSYLRSLNTDEPFVREGASSESYHTDALGSTLTLSNATGSIHATYTYEPFGKTTTTGTSANSFQFTGRENDGTGLYYYRARYYNPLTGRFISEDPIGLRGRDLNLYAYVRNQPTLSRDPFGLCYDPGGTGIRYCVQTFIPDQTALVVFKGDNRKPTCDDDPNAQRFRSFQYVTNQGSNFGPGVTRDIFGNSATGIAGPNGVQVSPLPAGGRTIRFTGQATNGLIPSIAPSLWYDFTITEDADGNTIARGSSSGFPALEVCQYGGPSGTKNTYLAPAGSVFPYIYTTTTFGAVLR